MQGRKIPIANKHEHGPDLGRSTNALLLRGCGSNEIVIPPPPAGFFSTSHLWMKNSRTERSARPTPTPCPALSWPEADSSRIVCPTQRWFYQCCQQQGIFHHRSHLDTHQGATGSFPHETAEASPMRARGDKRGEDETLRTHQCMECCECAPAKEVLDILHPPCCSR